MPDWQGIPIPNGVMQQIGIDRCNLSEVDGFKHLFLCTDYFSRWSEAKAVIEKSETTCTR